MTEPFSSKSAREVCYRCHKAASVCVCPQVVAVNNRTAVHIIQHPRERHKAVGTVRFAELGLRHCVVEDFSPNQPTASVMASQKLDGVALLSPGPKALAIETLPENQRPSTLIVLDGTWSQVTALRRQNPWLDSLPQLTFSAPPPSRYLIRAEPKDGYLSTIESIVYALSLLEPDTLGLTKLLNAFDSMVETQLVHCRTHRQSRFIHRSRPPSTLVRRLHEERAHQVLLYVETTGSRELLKLMQVCAHRLATGEQLECLIEPMGGWPKKLTHLGWRPNDHKRAVSEVEFRDRWLAFVRHDDVLVAWSKFFIDVFLLTLQRLTADRAESGTAKLTRQPLILKGVFATTDRVCGDIGVVLDRRGGIALPSDFTGRAAAHMGQALALMNSTP